PACRTPGFEPVPDRAPSANRVRVPGARRCWKDWTPRSNLCEPAPLPPPSPSVPAPAGQPSTSGQLRARSASPLLDDEPTILAAIWALLGIESPARQLHAHEVPAA